ncbi:alpha/beta fold hydrolase [Streptomyces klenkii]
MTTTSSSIHRMLPGPPEIITVTQRPGAEARLICLPPAGTGPEFYAPWPALLPDTIECSAIQLPGRGARADEPSHTAPHHLASLLAEAVDSQDDSRPFALFGHSLGALLAFETARCLRRTRRRRPLLVGLSSFSPLPSTSIWQPSPLGCWPVSKRSLTSLSSSPILPTSPAPRRPFSRISSWHFSTAIARNRHSASPSPSTEAATTPSPPTANSPPGITCSRHLHGPVCSRGSTCTSAHNPNLSSISSAEMCWLPTTATHFPDPPRNTARTRELQRDSADRRALRAPERQDAGGGSQPATGGRRPVAGRPSVGGGAGAR